MDSARTSVSSLNRDCPADFAEISSKPTSGITSGLPVIRDLRPDQLIMHVSRSSRLTPKYQIGLLVASDRISNRHAKSA
jgi:hypothetical protein